MVFQTGGEIKEQTTPFQTGGEVAVVEPFQATRFGGNGLSDEERRAQNDIFARFTTGERPVEQWLPEEQAEIARTLLDSLDDPIEERAKLENAILLSGLFGVDVDTITLMQPEMIKQIYGKELQSLSDSVVNKTLKEDIIQAVKETPENLWIGTIGMAASTLEAVKRQAMRFAGGGINPDESIRHQFEAFTPSPEVTTQGLIYDPEKLDSIRQQRELERVFGRVGGEQGFLPGALAGEAFGIVTRLPDIGAKILRSKQTELQREQDIAVMSNAPITRMARLVSQGGVPSVAVAAGMSLLTGNPLVGLAILGELEGGSAFQRQLEAGGSVGKSLIIGDLSAAAEIGGELLVFPKILKGLQEGISIRKAFTLIAENATQEGITGFNQTFIEVYGIETTKGTDKTTAAKMAFVAGYRAIPDNAFVGGMVAGLADIPSLGVGIGKQMTERQARRIADSIVQQVESDIAVEEAELEVVEPVEAVEGVTEAEKQIQKAEIALELEELSFKEIQQQAKALGIKANQKKTVLIEQIAEAQTKEAVEGPRVEEEVLLGLRRKEILDTTLQDLSDDEFEKQFSEAENKVLELEKHFDEVESLTRVEKIELAAAQDKISAFDNEKFRRSVAQMDEIDLVDTFLEFDFKRDSDKLQAALFLDELNKNPEAKAVFKTGLAAKSERSFDFNEIIQDQLGQAKKFTEEIGEAQPAIAAESGKQIAIKTIREKLGRARTEKSKAALQARLDKLEAEDIKPTATIPGTKIEFDEVIDVFDTIDNLVIFKKQGEEVHSFKVRNAAEAAQQVENFQTLLQPKPKKEVKPPPAKPSKAEQQVIDAKKFNDDIKQHEDQVKGEEGIIEIETEEVDDITEPLGKTMSPEWYKANSQRYKKTILEKGTDLAKETVKGLDFLGGTTRTRLFNISPELGRRLARHEFNVLTRTTEQTKRIEPFMKATTKRKLGKIDFNEFDLAYKNSDIKKMNELAVKHDFKRELAAFRRVNDELFNAGNAVGLGIDYLKDHFHRSVKDTKGFLEHFQGRDDWSIVRTVIEDKESQRGRPLTETERAAIVNSLLRGYRTSSLSLSAPGAAKERTVQEVDAEINQFYHSPMNSMRNYVETMNEKIAAREFFGRQSKEITKLRAQQSATRTRLAKLGTRQGKQKKEDADKEIRIGFTTDTLSGHIARQVDKFEEVTEKLETMGADDLSNTIGQYVLEQVNSDQIKPSQEKEVRDLLMGRFDPRGTHGIIGEIIPLTYIDVLTQFTSSITQLEEMALAFYNSPAGFIPALTKAIINLNEITLEDIGVTTIGQELTDVDSRKVLSTLLSVDGFKKLDALAKQTLINTELSKLRAQAKREGRAFNERLQKVFGDDTGQVVDELKAGEITEDVKFLVFSRLLDVQPIAKSEMPEAYNRAGNLRIFYQLRTFTLKQLDFVRTEALQDMRNPVSDPSRFMRGFGKLMWMGTALAIMGAGRDKLVDFMLGRPFNLSDSVIDTFLRRVFFSRFQYTKALQEGFGRAFLEGFLPATKTVDAITRDINKVSKGDEDGLEVWRSVPIAGEVYYWWFGRGRERSLREQAKAARETVRRKPLFTGRKEFKSKRKRSKAKRKPL